MLALRVGAGCDVTKVFLAVLLHVDQVWRSWKAMCRWSPIEIWHVLMMMTNMTHVVIEGKTFVLF